MKYRIALTALILGAVVNCYAADNSTYIEQTGDSANIIVFQDGAGNRVRGLPGSGTGDDTPAVMYGDQNQITISQVGAGNKMYFGVQTKLPSGLDAAGYAGNIFYYEAKGNNNLAFIDSNGNGKETSQGNTLILRQSGNLNNADVKIKGSANNIIATTSGGNGNAVIAAVDGDKNVQSISLTSGGLNTANITQTGANNTVTGQSVGYGNTIRLVQDGYGHSAVFDVIGTSNNITASQYGIGNTTPLTISIHGNSNSYQVAAGR